MNPEDLARKVNNALKIWSTDHDKLVVAIDGYTGVGKTTLLKNLESLNSDVLAVNRDDFLLSRSTVKRLLSSAQDRSKVFELQVCDTKKLSDLVHAFRNGEESYKTRTYNSVSGKVDVKKTFDLSKKIMVIEGVFMFHPGLLDHLWDKKIYLKGDITKIDKRRIKREKERWGEDYFPETHPDSYFKQVTIALKRYQEMYYPEGKADLVLQID